MNTHTSKMRTDDLKIAYIGGGSRGWAWGFMKDLAMDGAMKGEVRLYDIDRAAAEKNKIIGERISAQPQAISHWRYSVSQDLREALVGSDFVVISILPGTFEEMRWDVHESEKYGIYQSTGDTVGPGGLMRSLRCIPMFVEIAKAIRDYSPDAWVINYTNPMAVCVRTLYEVFPQVKAFGCCHEVFGTQTLLCDMLADQLGIHGVDRSQIATNVLGVNHFTWFDKASYQGMDLFPLYEKFVEKYYDSGFSANDENWANQSKTRQRVKFDLFRRYGLIAAAGDRHLAEFVPPLYMKNLDAVEEWQFELIPVQRRINELQDRLAQSERLASGKEAVELKGSGEEGHLLMKALLGLGDLVSNVNIPNRGQIANLPMGVVVETNALFRRDYVSPVFAGKLPSNVLSLVMPHAVNQENILHAALNCDRELALNALMNEPLVQLPPSDARALLESMLVGTKAYLPAGWGL